MEQMMVLTVLYRGLFARGEIRFYGYFSTCIVCFAFLWFCCSVLFGSGSLNVKN